MKHLLKYCCLILIIFSSCNKKQEQNSNEIFVSYKSDKEIKAYYERKVGEGKNKMSVINAIRNKLLLRIFAVLRDQRPYVENYQLAGV